MNSKDDRKQCSADLDTFRMRQQQLEIAFSCFDSHLLEITAFLERKWAAKTRSFYSIKNTHHVRPNRTQKNHLQFLRRRFLQKKWFCRFELFDCLSSAGFLSRKPVEINAFALLWFKVSSGLFCWTAAEWAHLELRYIHLIDYINNLRIYSHFASRWLRYYPAKWFLWPNLLKRWLRLQLPRPRQTSR